jgi:hypothetical protein
MALTVITAASTRRLTTLEAVEAELGMDAASEGSEVLDRMIGQASSAIERACGRIFAQQRYQEILLPVDGPWLFLAMTPIVSVSSLVLDGTAVTDYRVEQAEAGFLYRALGWDAWSTSEYTVQYVAGFIVPEQTNAPVPTGDLLPADVERAALEAVKVWYHERLPSDRIQSRTIGDQRIEYAISAGRQALPVLCQDLIAPWRRMAIA